MANGENLSPQQRLSALFQSETAEAAPAPQEDPGSEAPPEHEAEPERESAPEAEQPEAQAPEHGDEQAEPEGEGEVEEITAEHLRDVAEHFGLSMEDMYGLKFTSQGEREYTLGEVKDLVQDYERATKGRQEVEQLRASLREQSEQFSNRLQQTAQEAQSLLESIQSQINSDMESIDWAELRRDDPAEYSAKRTEFQERQARLQTMSQEAAQALQKQQRELQQQQQEAQEQLLTRERELLATKWPEFVDPERGPAERKALLDYLSKEGFSENELSGVMDHRLLMLSRKAMLYEQGQKAVAEIPKRRVIRSGKPGLSSAKRQSREDQSRSQQQKAREKLRKSGSVRDAAALIRQKMGG